jgi:hypothetical protein
VTERRLVVGSRALRGYFALGMATIYVVECRSVPWLVASVSSGVVLYWLLWLAMKGGETEALSPSCVLDGLGWSAAGREGQIFTLDIKTQDLTLPLGL